MNITLLGIDIAKDVFQLHGADARGKRVLTKRLKRKELLSYLANLPVCCIVMEACGGANYWAREIKKLGHEVKLISPQFVKPFVKGNKNDSRDAEAIVEAASRPQMRFVTPKTEEQQDIQSLLRVREGYHKMRTQLANQIRGLLAEYGLVIAKGISPLRKTIPALVERDKATGLTERMKELIETQYNMLLIIEERIAECDKQVEQMAKDNEICRHLQSIAGVGVLSAVAVVATVGEGKEFKNGRHFAAFLGLVPRQHASGNRNQLLGISKRGDGYLRKLLVHGARAVLIRADKKQDRLSQWVTGLKARRGANRACVALAHKNARIIMALLHQRSTYRQAA
ncbi:MAG: transposase [Gammaproteobacteria bacterium]|jgi:transposase|nr:transposase [Gammaproteobacteria bacterium]